MSEKNTGFSIDDVSAAFIDKDGNARLGVYLAGVFVSYSSRVRFDEDGNRKISYRAFISLGDYVISVSSGYDAFQYYKMGDEIILRVRLNVYNGNLYYMVPVQE